MLLGGRSLFRAQPSPPRGPIPAQQPGQATGALGVPGCLSRHTGRACKRGRGSYFKRHCGCLTNRCGRGFSFHAQLCSQPPLSPPPATWGPLDRFSGIAGKSNISREGKCRSHEWARMLEAFVPLVSPSWGTHQTKWGN